MKNFILPLVLIGLSLNLKAQDSLKVNEAGIVFANFNEFGLTYRVGNAKSVWRFNTLFLFGSNTNEEADSLTRSYKSQGIGLSLGNEFRKTIASNFELRYGADLTFRFTQTELNVDDKSITNRDIQNFSKTYSYGFAFVFGLNYVINQSLVLGGEILPAITYTTGKKEVFDSFYGNTLGEFDISGFSYGINNTAARLTVLYRF